MTNGQKNILKQILYTACVTPFNHDGNNIDYRSFEKILRAQEQAGNGILILGSTGESLSLSTIEREAIVKFTCDLRLKSEIIVGVPSYNLTSALEWLEICNQFPIDGYLMTTPIYTKPGIIGQTKWFEKLLEHSSYPAMVYNIPGRSGVKLHSETLRNIESHPNLLAIKDSSGTVDSIAEYKIMAPSVAVYCGDDYMMPSMAIEGAVGLVSVASNPWPQSTRRYVEAALSRKILKNKIWWQACKALFSASNPIPVKALLKEIDIIEHSTVRPPLSTEDLKSTKDLIFYHELINNWKAQ